MRASLAPRSAPRRPLPRYGSITPGLSNAYTSGVCEILRRVLSARVMPGVADVRSAFGVAIQIKDATSDVSIQGVHATNRSGKWERREKRRLTPCDADVPERVQQGALADVRHAHDQNVDLWQMRMLFGDLCDKKKTFARVSFNDVRERVKMKCAHTHKQRVQGLDISRIAPRGEKVALVREA